MVSTKFLSTCSPVGLPSPGLGGDSLAEDLLDVLDAGAFQRYWDAVVEPLIADAGPLAGKTLKYLHTDSWEVEPLNWTPTNNKRSKRYISLLPLEKFLTTVFVIS